VAARAVHGAELSIAKLFGTLVAFLAATTAAVPARRDVLARPLALVAVVLAALGSWTSLAIAVAAYTFAEWSAGGIRIASGRSVRNARFDSSVAFQVRIVWRAFGWRIAPPFIAACLPIAFAAFYVANNGLTAEEARLPVRTAGAIAMVIWFAIASDVLTARRAVWPWARSLPWSSRHRVLVDAGALALPAMPLLIALARISWRGAVSVALVTPLLSLLAIAASPRAHDRITGAGGAVILGGTLVGVLVGLGGWTVGLAVASTPLVAWQAARAERHRPVTAWRELHHDVAGDSLSWSTQ
jgi:hypothetical protein